MMMMTTSISTWEEAQQESVTQTKSLFMTMSQHLHLTELYTRQVPRKTGELLLSHPL